LFTLIRIRTHSIKNPFPPQSKKRPITLFWQSGLFLFSPTIEVPSSAAPIFYAAVIGFWVLTIPFLLTRGRKKVNNKEII